MKGCRWEAGYCSANGLRCKEQKYDRWQMAAPLVGGAAHVSMETQLLDISTFVKKHGRLPKRNKQFSEEDKLAKRWHRLSEMDVSFLSDDQKALIGDLRTMSAGSSDDGPAPKGPVSATAKPGALDAVGVSAACNVTHSALASTSAMHCDAPTDTDMGPVLASPGAMANLKI